MKKLIAFLIIAACWGLNTPSFAQTQLGGDMDGEAPLDRLGSAVALSADGNRLAAGAPGNDANGDKAGHVRVYELLNSAWIQMGEDIDGGTAFDGAGSSVDLSADGNRLAVGLPGHNAVLSGIGQVRIYEWLDGGWSQLGQAIDGQITNEIAGTSVSLSADGMKVAIGAPYKFDAGNGHPSGKVRIYKWFQGVWTQVGEDIIGSVLSDEFGVSVSLSADGNKVAIGASFGSFPTINGQPGGYVKIYEWINETWTQLGSTLIGDTVDDEFGSSVSLSADGNRVACGAVLCDVNDPYAGQVKVYEWKNESWTLMGPVLNGEAFDYFGASVSLSSDGSRLAATAPAKDGSAPNTGVTRVYEWMNGAWTQLGANIDGEAEADEAAAVCLSADGNRLAIGAAYNDGNGALSGHVRVFELPPVLDVHPVQTIPLEIYPNPTSGLLFFTAQNPESIKIMDATGRLVLLLETVTQHIDISHLPNGIYVVQAYVDGLLMSSRIIKD